MIIVEGPDGAGKTTLVNYILENESWLELQPRAVSKDAEAQVELDRWVMEELDKGFGPRLYDRFSLISSPNYIMLPSPTFRGECYNPDWLRAQHAKLAKIDPVIIVCLPPLEVVADNVMADPTDAVVQPWIDRIYGLYVNYVATQHGNSSVMVWDYTQQASTQGVRLGNLIRWVKARIEKGR